MSPSSTSSCFCLLRRQVALSGCCRRIQLRRSRPVCSFFSTIRKESSEDRHRYASTTVSSSSRPNGGGCFYDPNHNCFDPRIRWLSTVVDESVPTVSETTLTRTCSLSALLEQAGLDRSFLFEKALQRPTPLKLSDMYKHGTSTDPLQRLRNAQFLYQELPVRIAQRAVDLLDLPHGLSNVEPIQQVALIYLKFLKQFQDIPMPKDAPSEAAFTDMLQSFVLDRTSIPVRIAHGVHAWWLSSSSYENDAQNQEHALDRLNEMEEALNRFFTARVGLRFLTEHYVLSSNRESAKALRNVTSLFPVSEDSMRGCIQENCNVAHEVRRVADLVIQQTKAHYQMAPVIEIVDCTNQPQKHEGDTSTQNFTYVPHHLHYMVAELLKNSCRATIRRYQEVKSRGDPQATLSKIRVIIVKGEEDVTIKVADKGGGIPRSLMNKIWKFAHSTASEDELRTDFGTDISGARIRGFGLPLARIYARYFGGELTLKSTEGFGLDAYLHLPRLGTNCCENLPLRVRDSPGERDSTPSVITTTTTTKTNASSARRNNGSAWTSLPHQNRTYSTRNSIAGPPSSSHHHHHPPSAVPTATNSSTQMHHPANYEYCHNLAM